MGSPKDFIELDYATLHPPVVLRRPEDDDAAAARIPWVLVDVEAYVADHRNATTAFSHTESGKEIQVTFFLTRSPCVSYFCVFCPGRDHTEFPTEPKILAMDKNLVLLRIVVSPEKELRRDCDLYIYQANGAEDGGPSLERLPRPQRQGSCFFDYDNVGLMCCGGTDGCSSVLRPHCVIKDDLIVAALFDIFDSPVSPVGFVERPGQFALFVYNSKCQTWSINEVLLNQQQLQKQPDQSYFLHINSKVITIGGEAGTIGFVDLWRGILFCDVLKANPKLSYIPLPKKKREDRLLRGEACLHRDIAVIGGRIKYVEMESVWDPSLFKNHRYASGDWMTWKYSRPVAAASSVAAGNSCSDDWRIDCEIETSDDICVDNNPHFQMLPRPQDYEGRPLPPFHGLAIRHPALSLSDDDDTVYFVEKIRPGDDKAWVISVNLRSNELQGVAKFAAERTDVVPFAFTHSRISKYLTANSRG